MLLIVTQGNILVFLGHSNGRNSGRPSRQKYLLFIGAEHGAARISDNEHTGNFSIVFLESLVPPTGRIPKMFGRTVG